MHTVVKGLWRNRLAWAGLALCVLVVLTYWPALGTGFFSDDYTWLARMPATLESPSFVFSIFYRDFNPLLHASFAADDAMGGGSPTVYHATSLVLHAINASLLLFICHRLGASPWVALAAALLWALNCRLAEPVIWTAARGHSLATLWVLAAFAALITPSRAGVWIGAVCAAFGLLSKEVALFPLLIAPIVIPRRVRPIRHYVPIGVLVALFVIFNMLVKPSAHLPDWSPGALSLKLPFVLLRPLGLGDYYGFNWLHVALFLLAAGLALALLRRTVALRGFLWVAVCAVPIVPLQKLSSRYLYLLAIGYAIVFCGIAEWLASVSSTGRARRLITVVAVSAVILIILSNALRVRREIEDYALLSQPYARCLAALRGAAVSARPGETLVVADMSPRQETARMVDLVRSRGTSLKLIPVRPQAVGSLVELRDAVNIERRGEGGWYAVDASPTLAGPSRSYVYDGTSAAPGPIPPWLPGGRIFGARLVPLRDYIARERSEH